MCMYVTSSNTCHFCQFPSQTNISRTKPPTPVFLKHNHHRVGYNMSDGGGDRGEGGGFDCDRGGGGGSSTDFVDNFMQRAFQPRREGEDEFQYRERVGGGGKPLCDYCLTKVQQGYIMGLFMMCLGAALIALMILEIIPASGAPIIGGIICALVGMCMMCAVSPLGRKCGCEIST